MKVCFLSPGRSSVNVLEGKTSGSGGAEAQIAHLASIFSHFGHEVSLIYNDKSQEHITTVISSIRCINAYPSWTHPSSLFTFWVLLNMLAAEIFYARLPSDFLWIIGLYTKLHPKSQFIYALANDRDGNPWRAYNHKSWFHNPLYALGLKMADVVALQHEGQVEVVKHFVTGKCVLIPNLLQSVTQKVRNYGKADIDVIWIAQIRPQKQLSVLLDVAEALPHLQFTVVGDYFDPSCRDDLDQRIKHIKNLKYLGPVDHESTMQLLARSKVLVNTSYWEGFPNTMLEAWSLGVPVISLQIDPGNVIRRQGLGLVSGSYNKLVEDICKLVVDQHLNNEMGKKGQLYVRNAHSIEAVCRSFEEIQPGIITLGQVVEGDL
jgi:glycosyltransferase involved in cell wall biosynthesis